MYSTARLIGVFLLFCFPFVAQAVNEELHAFVKAAGQQHGAFGQTAAEFLVEHMPQTDREQLKTDFLLENLSLALKARKEFIWAQQLDDELFLNDVLPYAVLNETRTSWRADFYPQAAKVVAGYRTSGEAAQALNKAFFNLCGVHYSTKRKRADQSPEESMQQGKASCTGLSILLVDACRSVGIPARVAGTASWVNKAGNHTWVEIWDEGWHFLGADEYDPSGLDRGWFAADAAADQPEHAIWATSWKKQPDCFPMVWARGNRSVYAVNVTDRYAHGDNEDLFYVRLSENGQRMALPFKLYALNGELLQEGRTRNEGEDTNNMAGLNIPEETVCFFRFVKHNEIRELALERIAGRQTLDINWRDLTPVSSSILELEKRLSSGGALSDLKTALTRAEANRASAMIWHACVQKSKVQKEKELADKVISQGELKLRWLEKTFGNAPQGERSLFISMHGGGGAPASVNDAQWHNQIRLYKPDEGVVVAPRAPGNSWKLWHEDYIDDLFDRLIADFVAHRGVDPNRVYLMGYSAGGDGVYQLAPRMADRFAAASMMAGHPNDADPRNLRNLPFALFIGGKDAAYHRNDIAVEWNAKLDALRKGDPEGYIHRLNRYEGLGHWMNGRDTEVLPWLLEKQRNPWPKKLVWFQAPRTHKRFYWLEAVGAPVKGQLVTAQVSGNTIEVKTQNVNKLQLRLNDALLDLNNEIIVFMNGTEVFRGKVARNIAAIAHSLEQRADPSSAASVLLTVGGETSLK